jgi:hypothetical protein
MIEMIRSFGDNVRSLLRHLRPTAPRFKSRVAVKVSLLDYTLSKWRGNIPIMDGQTYNLSSTGLALILPEITLSGRSMVIEGTTLLVVLDLPNGIARFQAKPVHFRRADKYVKNSGYVVGIQITQIDDESNRRYQKFIERTERNEKISSASQENNSAMA